MAPLPPKRFAEALSEADYAEFEDLIVRARELLAGRVVWNVNSTARGGGVAELLQALVGYACGGGIDCRWLVIAGDQDFFTVTKRLHNRLHGSMGDEGPLGEKEHDRYERTLAAPAQELGELISPDDVVLLHDPQTVGLTAAVKATGALTIWRCHVGFDDPDDVVRSAWEFLEPYAQPADCFVFSREAFAWAELPRDRIELIAPSIDAFSPKNQDLLGSRVAAILAAAGVLEGVPEGDEPLFEHSDGTPGRVERRVSAVEDRPLRTDDPVVVQVSRWDALKDPVGVVRGFAEHVAERRPDAHLVLAGPDVTGVADDPEGQAVWQQVVDLRADLSDDVRARVHLLSLPMEDVDENAAIVNALQRHADIVVQKSLAEGFGLTVAEAMWKAKPVVATRVGGIQDQIVDGQTGVLLDDPHDLAAFGNALVELLADSDKAALMGAAARESVRDHFLGARHLAQYFDVIYRRTRERAAADDRVG